MDHDVLQGNNWVLNMVMWVANSTFWNICCSDALLVLLSYEALPMESQLWAVGFGYPSGFPLEFWSRVFSPPLLPSFLCFWRLMLPQFSYAILKGVYMISGLTLLSFFWCGALHFSQLYALLLIWLHVVLMRFALFELSLSIDNWACLLCAAGII